MIERKASTTIRPVSGAMNLSDGKPNAKEAFLAAGFTLSAICICAVGAFVLIFSAPSGYDPYTGARVIGMTTGGAIVLAGFVFGFVMMNLTVTSWQSYQKRLDTWNDVELEMYQRANGTETTHTISQTDLTPELASHVLLTALAIQWRMQTHTRFHHAPWSVRGLEEKLYLDGGTNAILLGELPGTRPEIMSERLAQLGLVTGRKPGFAGEWIAQSYDDVFDRVARNWSKLR